MTLSRAVQQSFAKLTSVVALVSLALTAATAQVPGRAITIIVPYTPGNNTVDILARMIGEELKQRLGFPVVVENKPGASGTTGTQMAARAPADGRTLLMTTATFTQSVGLFKNLPYHPIKSFAPIIQTSEVSTALAVHPSIPATSAQAFIDYVKSRPGQINYSSPGYGTPHHLTMELFKLATGIDIRHVPARGSAPAIQDLVGGHVGAMFLPVPVTLPLVQANQVRLLAVASKERLSFAPNVPTLAEQGVANVETGIWHGLFAPAGTPSAIVVQYNAAVNDILRSPHIVESLAKQGITIVGGSAEHFGAFIASDMARWLKVVKQAGIVAE
jgi:tripartite-type tricarboxylate transporter receptor subunit TctC